MNVQTDFRKYNWIAAWFVNHVRAFIHGFSELMQAPFASLMTIMVIGVAVALPAGFYLLLQNFQSLVKPWNGNPTISLYLKQNSDASQIKTFIAQLERRSDIRHIDYISPEQALSEFQKTTPLGNLVGLLPSNPLPATLVITPNRKTNLPTTLQQLATSLKTLPLVDTAELDMEWVQRLNDLLTLGRRVTYTIAVLFSIGVILIIGNTLRLTTENHRQDMNILKLVGATNAFIRRPLLYRGFLYGSLGGLMAWLLVMFLLFLLRTPAQHLANSYGSPFAMQGLSFSVGLTITLVSALMGWIGSWVAIRRHLTSPETL